MATMRTVKEIAQDFETDPRTLRKFLRDTLPLDEQPGKGSRYAIEAKQVRSLKTKFIAWTEARTKPVEDAENATEEVIAED
jgi:hypothetical protein